MPVTTSGIIAVLNYNIISLAAIFFVPTTLRAIFFYSCYYPLTYGKNMCSPFHFKIKSGSFFMRKDPKIALYDQVRFFAFKWQYVHKTRIIFNISFLKLFDFLSLWVVANGTSGKATTENDYVNFQMISLYDQSYIHTTNFRVHNYLIFPAIKYS